MNQALYKNIQIICFSFFFTFIYILFEIMSHSMVSNTGSMPYDQVSSKKFVKVSSFQIHVGSITS